MQWTESRRNLAETLPTQREMARPSSLQDCKMKKSKIKWNKIKLNRLYWRHTCKNCSKYGDEGYCREESLWCFLHSCYPPWNKRKTITSYHSIRTISEKTKNIIWYDMMWYDVTWYDMMWYDVIRYNMTWYDMMWYDMIWYDIHNLITCMRERLDCNQGWQGTESG